VILSAPVPVHASTYRQRCIPMRRPTSETSTRGPGIDCTIVICPWIIATYQKFWHDQRNAHTHLLCCLV
jgi:hypothetical protein